uniref:phage portal protein n=1 Tax=Bacillus sp. WP8 TaxID=756828 RepID=UPI0011A34DB1
MKKRKGYLYEEGRKKVDREKGKNGICDKWDKVVVEEKVEYVVGKGMRFKGEDERLVEVVKEFIEEDFDDCMEELVKNGSKKGKEWVDGFVDEEGKFDYVRIAGEEV